ncbi:dihydrofolate reductase [Alteromonadaceae bacterium Bs31]|nr:dihydrofolate reductase [Alteromonadaceae bacterium Bs31]
MANINIALVVAVARNGIIGRDNGMPWHLPEDFKHFKKITWGHPILMGRKTFESIGKALPGRTNIIVTRQKDWHAEGAIVASSLEQALIRGSGQAKKLGVDTQMVIGGAELYRQALPLAQRIYFTEVHADVEGDTTFPSLNHDQWQERERQDFAGQGNNSPAFSFVTLDRCG